MYIDLALSKIAANRLTYCDFWPAADNYRYLSTISVDFSRPYESTKIFRFVQSKASVQAAEKTLLKLNAIKAPKGPAQMICIITRHAKFRAELMLKLSGVGAAHREIDPDSELVISSIYDPKVSAVIIDGQTPQLAQAAWLDLLTSLSCRLPVFVLGNPPARSKGSDSRVGNLLGWLGNGDASSAMTILQAAGVITDCP